MATASLPRATVRPSIRRAVPTFTQAELLAAVKAKLRELAAKGGA